MLHVAESKNRRKSQGAAHKRRPRQRRGRLRHKCRIQREEHRLNKLSTIALAAAFTAGIAQEVIAAAYEESTNGDISDNRLSPTALVLDAGSNPVSGNFGISPVPNVADLDYLAVTVPNGFILSRLTLLTLNPGGANSFLAVQNGSVMTMAPNSVDPSPLLAYNHIYKNQQGGDLLEVLQTNTALPLGPLAAGTYTFWINETDTAGAYSYAFDFQVTAVPEPATHAMLGGGLAVLGYITRRRKQSNS